MLMRALSLPMVTMFLGTTLASCTREQPASSIIAPSDRALLGVGAHGGGPPGGVVFYSRRGGAAKIYTMNADGSDVTRVTGGPGDDLWPDISPNGKQIVFHSNRAGNYDIYVVNGDGSDLHAITTNSALDQWPDWSPDGQQIAFRRGNDVYVADASGTEKNVQRLTFFPTAINQMATWSPDGRRIAFMSLREGYCAVFLMNADGSDPANLTPKAHGCTR